jgi:membrane-associated phospholipid phosphatase
MEATLIVVALLAAVGGPVFVAASVLRWVAAHSKDLLAAARRASDRLHMQRVAGLVVRLWPPWLFGLSTALGLAVITSAAAGAAKLMEDITDGDGVAVLDHPVASFVAAHRAGALTMVMRAASTAGGPVVLGAVTVAVGVVLGIIWRSRGPVLVASVAVAGNGVLTLALKEAVARPRPPLSGALAAADGYAFPSGHAATAAAAFGVLAFLCAGSVRAWAARVAIWAGAAMLATLVGISRIYLGVHWTTDVLGGWAFGALWLAVVVTGSTVLAHGRGGRGSSWGQTWDVWPRTPGPTRLPGGDGTADAGDGGQRLAEAGGTDGRSRGCDPDRIAEQALRARARAGRAQP